MTTSPTFAMTDCDSSPVRHSPQRLVPPPRQLPPSVTKVYPRTQERIRNWKPFGTAVGQDISDVTTVENEVKLVLRAPWIDYTKEERIKEVNELIDKMVKEVEAQILLEERARQRESGKGKPEKVGPAVAPGTYVPPNKRLDAGGSFENSDPIRRRADENTIVIKELNQTTEEEIELLFKQFGETNRINCLFEDKEAPNYVRIAFITYRDREDAEKAIAAMHRHPLHSMLLHVAFSVRKNN